MKTPLCTEVDIGTGHIVLDGFPALRERGTAPPFFRSMSVVATVAHLSYCWALVILYAANTLVVRTIVVLWSVVQRRTPVLRTTCPMVGCSRHVSWLEVHWRPSAVVNNVHRTASTVRLRVNRYR